jgi:ABC-type Fe3+ transport system substrate-binding protein
VLKQLLVLGAIGVLIAAPLTLRERPAAVALSRQTLVIITPHGEGIRSEFTQAFRAWAARERHQDVDIDWRTPGGTSEITRYLDGRFAAAFAFAQPQFTASARKAFNQAKLPADASDAQRAARTAFLASNIGVDVDLLFGGGEFPFRGHAAKGYLVDAGVVQRQPQWFTGTTPIIPQMLSGETVYDPQGRYFSACFALFGIAWSPDRLADLGLSTPPTRWEDLGTPAYFKQLTLADPTKSGAVVTAMERIIQQRMAETLGADGQPDLAAGWRDGFALLKRMVANSRAITDSASKPTRDTVRGDCLASMAIDFQAKSEAEWALHESDGKPRLEFTVPAGGTSVSGDPIALLRGAPHPELAKAFIEFVLSPEGQRLWNYRLGVPGGPRQYALRRMSVRRDLYTAADRAQMSDPDTDPFTVAETFTYHPAWTAAYYPLIGPLVKATALDPRGELTRAWEAIIRAGGPARVPEAWEEFTWLPFAYAEAAAVRDALAKGPEIAVPLQREWLETATIHYRLARAYAEAGR